MAERDGCAVDTAILAGIIRGYADALPADKRDSAFVMISERAGVSVSTLHGIARHRFPTTELRTADSIITRALGRPEVFWDGTLPVQPNPYAGEKARAQCCPGPQLPEVGRYDEDTLLGIA